MASTVPAPPRPITSQLAPAVNKDQHFSYMHNHMRVYCRFTHLPLDKMAAILAEDISKCIFVNENAQISIKISLKFVS